MKSLNGSILPMSTLLPEPVRAALVRASKIDGITADWGESPERTAAVDAAAASAKAHYPQYFK